MKKTIKFVLVFLMLFSFVGYIQNNNNPVVRAGYCDEIPAGQKPPEWCPQ